MMVFMGAVVGGMVIAMYLPLFKVIKVLAHSGKPSRDDRGSSTAGDPADFGFGPRDPGRDPGARRAPGAGHGHGGGVLRGFPGVRSPVFVLVLSVRGGGAGARVPARAAKRRGYQDPARHAVHRGRRHDLVPRVLHGGSGEPVRAALPLVAAPGGHLPLG